MNHTPSCTPSKPKIVITAVYTSLVLLTSVIPMQGRIGHFSVVVGLTPIVQNFLHVPMFAILTILWLQVFNADQKKSLNTFVLILSAAFVFSAMNELIQLVIPGRYTGVVDLSLNIGGVALGAMIFLLVEKMKPGAVRRLVCG